MEKRILRDKRPPLSITFTKEKKVFRQMKNITKEYNFVFGALITQNMVTLLPLSLIIHLSTQNRAKQIQGQ